MTRYRLEISYEGTAYSGYAAQPGRRTIQGEVERALAVLYDAPVRVAAAGRTDAGVHALAQVLAFDAPETAASRRQTDGRFAAKLAGLLDPDIRPVSIAAAPDSFDPRRDALAREYLYLIAVGPAPLVRHLVWERGQDLDTAGMVEAAGALTGVHDFTSYCLADAPEPHMRDLMALDVSRGLLLGAHLVVVRAIASAFLHGMVRALVGTLVEVGRGKREPRWVRDVLDARDRRAAGPGAPPSGLVLARVYYRREDLDAALVGQVGESLVEGLRKAARQEPSSQLNTDAGSS